MSQPTSASRPSALKPIARHPWIALLLVAAMGLVGAAIGWSAPVVHKAEARLSVGPASNSAYVISGYPLAARDLAANYSRFVQNNTSDPTWVPAGVSEVGASPIPDSSVVRIEATATDPALATAGAKQVATRLVDVVGEQQAKNDPELVFAQFEKMAPQVAVAQAKVENAKNDRARQEARTGLATLQLRRDAYGERYRRLFSDPQVVSRLQVIQPARIVSNSKSATVARWSMVGLGAGAVLALLATTVLDRRRRTARAAQVLASPKVPTASTPERELTSAR